MFEFASHSEHPRVRYADVMIGDCLRLESLESLESAEEPVVEIEEQPEQETELAIAPEEPPPPPEPQVIPTRILFEFDSAVLQERWNDDLAQLAEYITREKPKRVIVEGHACWIGSDEYNLKLSERRARVVIEHLVSKHALDRGIFEVEAYGESLPEASNETQEGRENNRRAAALVLFRVVPTL
jgi:outer membrane protein OmpA-like peptidoglycan-associated protein